MTRVGRLAAAADAVLRGGPVGPRGAAAVAAAGGAAYGAVMGGFGGSAAQAACSAVKVPLLLAAATALTLPGFYVLHALAGLRADFPAAVRAVAAAQAAVGLVLASLAPYTAVWYLSVADYRQALGFNVLAFGAAAGAAQVALRRRYAPLVARNPRHRLAVAAWVGGYAFVGVQLAWVLRPFVGAPGSPAGFFRPGAWGGNAYEAAFAAARAAVGW